MKNIYKFLDRIIEEPRGYTHEISIAKIPKKRQLKKWNNYINKKQLNGILALSYCETCKEHNHKKPFHFSYFEKKHLDHFNNVILYNDFYYDKTTLNKLEIYFEHGGI